MRHVVHHFRSGERAGPRRVHGDVDDVELHLLDQRPRVQVGGLGLAGEADDHVSDEADVRHEAPRFLDDASIVACLVSACHAFEHRVISGLNGQLELATHHVTGSHNLEQLRLEPQFGEAAHEAKIAGA